MKSVFPTVEEYLLLDVLSNSDNNVQKAADKLVKMGYVKRDTPSKKHVLKSLEYQNKGIFKHIKIEVWHIILSLITEIQVLQDYMPERRKRKDWLRNVRLFPNPLH